LPCEAPAAPSPPPPPPPDDILYKEVGTERLHSAAASGAQPVTNGKQLSTNKNRTRDTAWLARGQRAPGARRRRRSNPQQCTHRLWCQRAWTHSRVTVPDAEPARGDG
jgi:hypothetical protein